MFTGIVTAVGTVADTRAEAGGREPDLASSRVALVRA
jgi:riboflavin synthase alpha subunit